VPDGLIFGLTGMILPTAVRALNERGRQLGAASFCVTLALIGPVSVTLVQCLAFHSARGGARNNLPDLRRHPDNGIDNAAPGHRIQFASS
jgi:hypothetical protein